MTRFTVKLDAIAGALTQVVHAICPTADAEHTYLDGGTVARVELQFETQPDGSSVLNSYDIR